MEQVLEWGIQELSVRFEIPLNKIQWRLQIAKYEKQSLGEQACWDLSACKWYFETKDLMSLSK